MAKYLFIAANEAWNWDGGGSELLWSLTAEKLAKAGNEVRVSARHFSEPIPLLDRLRSAGCQIVYRRMPPPLIYRAASKILPLGDYNRRQVRSAASGVDLVVISQGGNHDGLLWMQEAQDAGLKYAVIAENAPEVSCPDDETAGKLAKAYEGAAGAYFVSEANVKVSRRHFGTSLDGARVVRNPFKVRYQARPPWPADPSHELSLACVARLDAGHKAQDILLDVLSLPHWRERSIHVSLVGNGPNEHLLRRLAEELKLTTVEFAGHSANIEEVWSQHHALILTSRFEGMPIVVIEAMLCGRPCIATDVGGNRELIRDGVNGFLAKAPTVEFVDEAMNRAWENRGRLREMGERAAIDVRQWVSPDPVGDFVRDLTALVHNSDPA